MRVACLIPWVVIGLLFPGQIPNLFGQSVATLIHDVSDMADGSVTQARIEAQRQAASGNLAYRSYTKGDPSSFSGKYTPPELPDDKKGRFVYGLALFSDDGCSVTVNGSLIHQRMGQGQHLPNISDSFHVLQTALAPGEPTDIIVDYSNIIYDDDPDSPGYPDIDGCTLFLYLIPAGIAVDANRDGTIAFSGETRDTTSQDAPYRFWCNDDNDGLPNSEGDVVDAPSPDYEDGVIQTARDLEDFVRLHLFIDAFREELTDGTFKIGLKFKDVGGTHPKIKVYKSTDSEGSDSYLEDDQNAFAQLAGKNAEALGEVTDGNPMYLPQDFWTGNHAGSKKCLLFEAGEEGKGELVMTIDKSNGAQIGEGPSVWLDLKNIKKMYQRQDGSGQNQWQSVVFEKDSLEQPVAIVFVHGWRMSPDGASNFAETMFKRLWHRGYKGRFGAFRWNTHWSDDYGWVPYAGNAIDSYLAKYNDSEYNAWLAGTSLASFINSLPSGYSRNVAAHSMGNIVVGSALLAGASIQNYALMHAAVPAACYDDDEGRIAQAKEYTHTAGPLSFTMWDEQTPDDDQDPAVRAVAYRGQFKNVGGNLINFFLPQDYATSYAWEINNDQTKPPNASLAENFRYNRYNLNGTKLYKYNMVVNLEVLDHYLTDPYEAMPYACRTWGKVVGAERRTEGSIDDSVDLSSSDYNLPGESSGFGDEHSGEFNARIQQLTLFYNQILTQFDITPSP
jgi:hypothetical protein